MEIRRDPNPTSLREQHRPLTRRRPAPADDLVRESGWTGAEPESDTPGEDVIERLLDGAYGQPSSALPAALRDVMPLVTADGRFSDRLRARAWDVLATGSDLDGDLAGALEAAEQAATLEPSAPRAAGLIVLRTRAYGPGEGAQLAVEHLEHWPEDVVLLAVAADLALALGATEVARSYLDHAQRLDPAHPAVLAAEARLLLTSDGLEEPERALDVARRMVATDPVVGRAFAAVALARLDRLADDPGIIEGVLANPPLDAWLMNRFAGVLLGLGRFADAESILGRTIEFAPAFDQALRTRGYVRALQGDLEGAERDLVEAAFHADDDWLRWMQGEIARLRGDLERAVRLFESVSDEEIPQVNTSLARTLTGLGDAGGAKAAYERALARDEEDVDAWCGLGQVLLDADDVDGALEDFLRAADIAPRSATAHALVGEALRRSHRTRESLAEFEKALDLVGDYAYALASKGQALIELRDVEAGLECLERAALVEPTTRWILDELVRSLEEERPDRADRVLRRLQRSVRSDGGEAGPLLVRRAQLAARQLRWDDAERLLAQARSDQPADAELARQHVEALRRLGRELDALAVLDELPSLGEELRWLRIDMLWDLERLTEARADLEELRQEGGAAPVVAAALGELQRAEGQRDDARRLLTEALSDSPGESYALASLGALEYDEGHIDKARLRLREALEIEPGNAFALRRLAQLEIHQGEARAVRNLIDAAAGQHEPGVVEVRAAALADIGELAQAWQVVDDHMTQFGQSAQLLRTRGWIEVALHQPDRAAETFELADRSDSALGSTVLGSIDALLRIDRWSAALKRASEARDRANPYTGAAVAMIALHTGHWSLAAEQALATREACPHSRDAAWIAGRALRRNGDAAAAVQHAQVAVRFDPRWPPALISLGEAHLAEGRSDAARTVFSDAVETLGRTASRSSDDLRLLAWSQVRLGWYGAAGDTLLTVLSATDQVFETLLDLLLTTILNGESRQAELLVHRVRKQRDMVERHRLRGALGDFGADMASVWRDLPRETRSLADEVTGEMQEVMAGLDPVLEDLEAVAR